MISVVVPAFDEAARIGPTLVALARHLDDAGRAHEIVVVDDGSRDGTADACRRLGLPAVRVLVSPRNRGKGHAVRVGMLAARGAIRLMWDADGSAAPDVLPTLVAALGSAPIAIGTRSSLGEQPAWRRAWGRLVRAVLGRLVLPGLTDTQCGYKAFRCDVADELFAAATVDGWAFDVELLLLARARGHAIVEVPIAWRHDPRSRIRPWRDLLPILAELARILVTAPRGTVDRPEGGSTVPGTGAAEAAKATAEADSCDIETASHTTVNRRGFAVRAARSSRSSGSPGSSPDLPRARA